MKTLKIYFLLMLLIQTISISAQSVISGKITNNDSSPIVGATILLSNGMDSTYITGTTSDLDGRFKMINVKSGNYFLSLSMIGYKKANIPLQIKESMNLELGDITLEEDSYILSTVNIIGKRPPIKAEPGKMTVNLSSALLSTDGNILDALRKLPGVIVQNDGTIILNGKSGANVLMDDKVTYLSGENLINYLRSIPASSIENIELISQPSSKHDASGSSGIINIQKKKIKEQGISLTASSGLEQGKHTKGNENLTLNFHHNKLNMYADYSYYWGKDFIELSVSGHYLDPMTLKPLELRKDFDSDINRQYKGHYIKTGVDYDLSEKIAIGTYFSSSWLNRNKQEVTVSDFFNNDKTQSDSTLTAEQLATLQRDAPTFWAKLDGDVREYLEQIIACNEETEEMRDLLNESLTQVSFDDVFSSFLDALSDMDSSSEEFANNFEKYMQKAILNSMLIDNYKSRINEWYKASAKANESGGIDEKEYADLQESWNGIVSDALEERNALMQQFGWSSGEESSSQSSTQKGFAAMSQDTGDELNGRFTALQISNEEIKNSMLFVLGSLSSLCTTASDSNLLLTDMRNLAVMSNGHLEDIAKYTKVLLGFGEKLDNIDRNTKNI